jgi:hypothetical protein
LASGQEHNHRGNDEWYEHMSLHHHLLLRLLVTRNNCPYHILTSYIA